MKIVLTGVLENISTRSDGSIKVVIGSQEMDESNAGQIFGLRNKFIKILLSDSNISEMEESLINEQQIQNGKKVKTKSQRMRAVLYRLHESNGGNVDTFQAYYDERMELMIDQIKARIEA